MRILFTLTIAVFWANLASASESTPAQRFKNLDRIAVSSLKQNIFTLSSGDYLAAGAHQFKSLWTRDFCFASKGLLAIGRADVVKLQLTRILDELRISDGIVPRYLGSASHIQRKLGYLLHTPIPLKEPLQAEYSAGGGSEGEAIDSNALVLLAALNYFESTGDLVWFKENLPKLVRVYRFYDKHQDVKDGLIIQGAFADWQDSVNRSGKDFFVNLLYVRASEKLAKFSEFGITPLKLAQQRAAIELSFKDPSTGLYTTLANNPRYVTLDGNLLAIDLGYLPKSGTEAKHLYANLKAHPLWKSADLPGFNCFDRYPVEWIGKLPKLINVADYHDSMYWSWLMGLSAKVAGEMGDSTESDRIFSGLEALAKRDGVILEVYEHSGTHVGVTRIVNQPVLARIKMRIYRAERPFSWGSGMIVEALRASQ